jgi:hypothetical protein
MQLLVVGTDIYIPTVHAIQVEEVSTTSTNLQALGTPAAAARTAHVAAAQVPPNTATPPASSTIGIMQLQTLAPALLAALSQIGSQVST